MFSFSLCKYLHMTMYITNYFDYIIKNKWIKHEHELNENKKIKTIGSFIEKNWKKK